MDLGRYQDSKSTEENILALEKAVEEKDKMLLRLECWLALPAIAVAIVLAIVAACIEMPLWLKIILIAIAVVTIIVVALVSVGIEQKAGYYECQHCRHRHVPTYGQALLALHVGRTRYMKCPECGKRSWQKKVLTAHA